MKTEKISSLVLYVVFAVIILLFGVFFTYCYHCIVDCLEFG